MPYRFINIDLAMVTLNTTSLGIVALAWIGDNLNTIGGFAVMMSVVYLNYKKGQALDRENQTKDNARNKE
jgi:hypothetical protein